MNNNELRHHGILGQKWGVRRFQNKDGTLTPEGWYRNRLRRGRVSEHDLIQDSIDEFMSDKYKKIEDKYSDVVMYVNDAVKSRNADKMYKSDLKRRVAYFNEIEKQWNSVYANNLYDVFGKKGEDWIEKKSFWGLHMFDDDVGMFLEEFLPNREDREQRVVKRRTEENKMAEQAKAEREQKRRNRGE